MFAKLKAALVRFASSRKVQSVARHAVTAAAAVLVPALLSAHGAIDVAALTAAGGAAARVVLLAVSAALGLEAA
jgi:hypothetical protein